jgi:hypothetical protein
MKVIDLQKEAENEELLGLPAIDDGSFKTIYPGTVIQIAGETEMVYGRLEGDWSELVGRLRAMKYQRNTRVARLKLAETHKMTEERTYDRTFGFKPANHIMGISAGACELNRMFPKTYEELIRLGAFAIEKYKQFHPEKFKKHFKDVKAFVKDHWLIPGTPYTQGIVNNTSKMRYHYDRNNFKGVWSVMAYFCHAVGGGELLIPSMKVKLKIEDHTFVLFNGNGLIHGVTEIKKLRPSNYRYSIVYYSRQAMIGLGSFEEEMDRILKSEIEKHKRRVEDKK